MRVLVIEDNAANLELMTFLLTAFGHTPLVAMDGREGLDAARNERPDIILCDIQLPTMSGFEIVAVLKADSELRIIPTVAVTALAMVGDRERVLRSGFDGYIAKPIAPQTFVSEVENFYRTGEPVRPATPTSSTPGRNTIVVVDDVEANRQVIHATLEPLGFAVFSARQAAEVPELIARVRPDLILTDIHMPGCAGYDLIQTLRSDNSASSVPIVCMTSAADPGWEVQRCIELGAAGFIQRPIPAEQLIEHVRRYLKKEASNGSDSGRR